MCGRFNLRTPLTVLSQRFLFDLPPDVLVSPRYNIAPTQSVVTVRQPASGERREMALMHWGLIPSWAKDAKIASSLINARSETLAEKPSFRTAFARRRCLILADGFYEWKKEGKQKLPFCFELANQQPFALAGLWERWRGPEGSDGPPLESCTIVTTTANELCRPLHERMPVILEPADYDLWLDPAVSDAQQLLPLLAPFPADEMQSRPVNPRVNNAKKRRPRRAHRRTIVVLSPPLTTHQLTTHPSRTVYATRTVSHAGRNPPCNKLSATGSTGPKSRFFLSYIGLPLGLDSFRGLRFRVS